jgi:hypothetical protein
MAYDWDDDLQRFCRSASRGHVDSPSEEWLAEKLNQAAALAKAGNLRDAAKLIEEIRARVVAVRLFHSWDDGILCFGNLISVIRRMSPETQVPSEYQKLLDAQPSLKWDEDMTKKQKVFWYGSSNAEVGGTLMIGPASGSSGKSGCVVIALGLLTGSLGLAALCMLCH